MVWYESEYVWSCGKAEAREEGGAVCAALGAAAWGRGVVVVQHERVVYGGRCG